MEKICICKVCFNPVEDFSFNVICNKEQTICINCFSKLKVIKQKFIINGISGVCLYEYNDFFKELIYKFKGLGDIELRTIFLEYFKFYIKFKFKNYIFIGAPSHHEAIAKRRFNHIYEIFKYVTNHIFFPIQKINNIKQSDQKYNERTKIHNNLRYDSPICLKDKKVVIVDDIMTSQSTIKAMINLVEKQKPKQIKILILARVMTTEFNN